MDLISTYLAIISMSSMIDNSRSFVLICADMIIVNVFLFQILNIYFLNCRRRARQIFISFVYVTYVNIDDEQNATIRLNVQLLTISFWLRMVNVLALLLKIICICDL